MLTPVVSFLSAPSRHKLAVLPLLALALATGGPARGNTNNKPQAETPFVSQKTGNPAGSFTPFAKGNGDAFVFRGDAGALCHID